MSILFKKKMQKKFKIVQQTSERKQLFAQRIVTF